MLYVACCPCSACCCTCVTGFVRVLAPAHCWRCSAGGYSASCDLRQLLPTRSVWTIHLAHLLFDLGIKATYCSQTTRANYGHFQNVRHTHRSRLHPVMFLRSVCCWLAFVVVLDAVHCSRSTAFLCTVSRSPGGAGRGERALSEGGGTGHTYAPKGALATGGCKVYYGGPGGHHRGGQSPPEVQRVWSRQGGRRLLLRCACALPPFYWFDVAHRHSGHFIVLTGFDSSSCTFSYLDPATRHGTDAARDAWRLALLTGPVEHCTISAADLDVARKSEGTEYDTVILWGE